MNFVVKVALLMVVPLSVLGTVRNTMVRALELQVVDAVTKKPLPNIVIYYRIESAGPGNFFGISRIDPIIFRDLRSERFETDENGKVYISEYKAKLKLYEKLYMETVTINMDIGAPNVGLVGKPKQFFIELSKLRTQGLGNIINPSQQYESDEMSCSWEKNNTANINARFHQGSNFIVIELRKGSSRQDKPSVGGVMELGHSRGHHSRGQSA